MRETPPGFWAVWTSVAVDLLGFGIIIPLLPLYAERFGASPVTIGFLFASFSLAQFLFSPVWGRLSDSVGRKPVLLVTIAGSALGSLILGLAGSIVVLFIGRVVDGISGASVAVARATVADQASPEMRPRLMGLLGAAFGLGFVVGPALGSLSALGGPKVPFFVAAALSTGNLIAAWFRVPETHMQASDVSPGRVSWTAQLTRLVAVTFMAMTAFGAFEATFSLLADARLGVEETEIGFVFAGLGLVIVATQGGLIGPLTQRLSEVGVLRLGIVSNVIGLAILAFAESWAPLIAGLALLAFGQGLVTPTLSSLLAGTVRSDRAGSVLGVQQSASGLARIAGPALGGTLFAVGMSVPYVAAAALMAVALVAAPTRRLAMV